jgi:beta-glucuronidase
MIADLQLLRDLGCNFIRGSHYPQDQRFLNLCDEFGFLVWEENLGWGQREKTFASEKFRSDHDTSLRAMVRASYNHPSVIIWGFLNEAGTDAAYVRPAFEQTVATLRALDPTRLISYASMFAFTDRCFDLVDLIALNLYPGWYGCEGAEAPLELIGPHLQKCIEHIDTAGFGDKPAIVSEIGAEGLYGWHDAHDGFFTEEYQAAYLRRTCQAVLENPRWSGIALWHFSDVRTYGGGWSLKRPRAFNNKGTLDEYRRPKAAYKTVKAVFAG